MNRRIGHWLVAASLTALLLMATSCASSSPSAPTTSATSDTPARGTSEAVRLDYWRAIRFGGEEALTQKILDDYKKEKPNVTINVQYFPFNEYADKLKAATAAKTLPDLFIVDTHEPAYYAANNAVEPLPTDLAEFVKSNTYEGSLLPVQWKNTIIGVPQDATNLTLAYNISLVTAAGLDPTNPPKDWVELTDWAQKLTKRDSSGKITQAGINLEIGGTSSTYYGWFLAPFIGGAGSKLWTSPTTTGFLDEGFIAAVQLAKDLVNVHKVSDRSFGMNEFISGKVGMTIFGPWDYTALKNAQSPLDLGYIPVPPRKAGDPPSIMPGGWHLLVAANSQQKEAAWEYVRFSTKQEYRADWAKFTASSPTYKDVANDPFFQTNDYYKLAAELQEKAVIPYASANAAIYDLYEILGAAIERAVYEGADVRTELTAAKAQVEAKMAALNK